MNANIFFKKCNDIIAGVTAPSAVTSFAENMPVSSDIAPVVEDDFADDDFAEDDFIEDDSEVMSDESTVHKIQPINFKKSVRQTNTFLEYVKEDIAPGEWDNAIGYWNFAHNRKITTEEELCRAFAAERYAVTFSSDVNVSELAPDDVISHTASETIVTRKELSGVANDSGYQELKEICGFPDDYEPTDFILGMYAAYKAEQITRFDLRKFALFSHVYDCNLLSNREATHFNNFLINELCNRIGATISKCDGYENLGDTVLVVRNGSLLISDAVEAFINFNRLALAPDYVCDVLKDCNGVVFYLKSASKPSASIYGLRICGIGSIEKWAFSSDKIDTFSHKYNLVQTIQQLEKNGNQVAVLREQLKCSYSDYLVVDQAFRYVCVYNPDFAGLLLTANFKRMIKCIRRFVYVQDRANFIYDVLVAFFGSLVKHDSFAKFDPYLISVVMLGKVQELKMPDFLKSLDNYCEIMKGYKNSVIFVEDGKLFVKIW